MLYMFIGGLLVMFGILIGASLVMATKIKEQEEDE